jgi:MSHA pilin protein MshB
VRACFNLGNRFESIFYILNVKVIVMIKNTAHCDSFPRQSINLTHDNKHQRGFTLIELVVVIVMIGFLAVNAIPKFIDLTVQAKQANIEGMAGGFATGVSLVRSQWESEARPKDTSGINLVSYDGTTVYLTSEDSATTPAIRPGYIVGTSSTAGINSKTMAVADCIAVWDSLLQQPPKVASTIAQINSDNSNKYLASVSGSAAATLCYYHLKETLARDTNDDYLAPAAADLNTVGNSFSYQPANSSVVIYINDNS